MHPSVDVALHDHGDAGLFAAAHAGTDRGARAEPVHGDRHGITGTAAKAMPIETRWQSPAASGARSATASTSGRT